MDWTPSARSRNWNVLARALAVRRLNALDSWTPNDNTVGGDEVGTPTALGDSYAIEREQSEPSAAAATVQRKRR